MVIAGELIDFIGMTLPSEHPGIETSPSAEERAHGLGNARDHTLAKLRAVTARHAPVFDAFGRFLGAGHAITIIHGNHDLELYWDDVREALTHTLIRSRGATRRGPRPNAGSRRGARPHRVQPVVLLSRRLAYIEHGHQYDEYCATEHVLAPLSPTDPRRVARGFCDVLLRFVVRPTPGLSEHGHEEKGIVDYLRFGLRLGVSGMVVLALRFVQAIRELFRLRRANLAGATGSLRAQHEQALKRFAARGRWDCAR